MKPDQQFIFMISTLMQQRPQPIGQSDLIKHSNSSITYYSLSQAKFIEMKLTSQTELFSDQILIEITRNAHKMIIGNNREEKTYQKLSDMQLTYTNEQPLIHWRVSDEQHNMFTAVKLLAPDGVVQIKLISFDNTTQIIHNVCELPDMG